MKFGTSGLRGLSVDLLVDAPRYVVAFAEHMLATGAVRKGGQVLVGQDFRADSPEIAALCHAALWRSGLTPVDCGAVPTPALALEAMVRRCPALMVTGSHIPADRNGIKFYKPEGEIDKSDELEIARRAFSTQATQPFDGTQARAVEDVSEACAARFFARNAGLLPKGALEGLKIGVYQHSSVARDLLVDLLAHFGADVVALGRSGSFVPVDTEAVSRETVAKLEGWARDHRLDAIVSADGDGDRPLVADETGVTVRGDILGLIAAQFLGAGVVATPVTSSSGLEGAGAFAVLRSRVGSPFVIAAMEEALSAGHEKVIGFEANGGLLTASPFTVEGRRLDPLPTRDSVLPVLAILSLRARKGEPLSAIVSGLGLPFALADRLENIPVETSGALMAHLRRSRETLSAFLTPIGRVADVSDLDGLRVTLTDNRIIHIRPSGNAPELRCYVEAGNEAEARDLLARGLALIGGWAGVDAAHQTRDLES